MKKISWILVVSLIIFLGIYSCRKIESLPPVPHIEYRSFEVFDSVSIHLGNQYKAGRLKFYFEDGDGDLGRQTSGEESEVSEAKDIYIKLYRKSGGVMVPAYYTDSEHTISFNMRRVEKEGQNKILKGTIEVTYALDDYFSITDTAKFDFYIMDRAMNESNLASTNEVVVSENGIY